MGLEGKGEEGSTEINTVTVLGGLNQFLGQFKMATFDLISVADYLIIHWYINFNSIKEKSEKSLNLVYIKPNISFAVAKRIPCSLNASYHFLSLFEIGMSTLSEISSLLTCQSPFIFLFIQSLAILLDAAYIFLHFIVFWVHMRYCSVTIGVYRCNNVKRLLLYKNNSFIIMSQL